MLAPSTRRWPAATIRVVEPVTVLVVDDLAWFRAATDSVIAVSDGFICAGDTDSGEHAITFLEQRPVDLVLMDVRMPGMGGIAAADQIRRRFPRIAIVLLSVHDESDLPDRVPPGCQFCHKDRFGPDALEALWRRRGTQR